MTHKFSYFTNCTQQQKIAYYCAFKKYYEKKSNVDYSQNKLVMAFDFKCQYKKSSKLNTQNYHELKNLISQKKLHQ
jgi:hypothetical protein